MNSIFHIQQGQKIEEVDLEERIGMTGMSMLNLAAMDLPVSPGFIMEVSKIEELPQKAFRRILDASIQKIANNTGKGFENGKPPLMLKIVLSPGMILESVPILQYLGLNNQSVQDLARNYDSNFAFSAYRTLIEGFSKQFLGIEQQTFDDARTICAGSDPKAHCEYYLTQVVRDFPQNPYSQLEIAMYGMVKNYFTDPLNREIPASVVVQYIPYGSRDNPSLVGSLTTRNTRTGEPKLNGNFCHSEFLDDPEKIQELQKLDQRILDEFEEIAATLEGHFLDIRQVDFVIEAGKARIIQEKGIEHKSVVTKMRILSDLQKNQHISEEEFINSFAPKELNSLLHSTINPNSVKDKISFQGGIGGSLGATCGRVFFSTKKLIDAYWKAKNENRDTRVILMKKSTFAEDVQAVEIGSGVITSEGGYTSHAPIVARSLGKPAIIYPDITFKDGYIVIGRRKVKEGQFVSMEITSSDDPVIILGKAELEYPDIEQNGVKNLLEKAKQFAGGIKIFANADNPDEAKQAKLFGADGIGLCRTEHMFLRDNRIYDLRELLITRNPERKKIVLEKIRTYLTSDFYELFNIMSGMSITVRLLDAPLHEFLPTDENELNETLSHLPDLASEQSKAEISRSFNRLKETNPMLGHRGCRVGISSPEIYDVQTAAILDAALKAKTENNIRVFPSIMLPLIMSQEEMYLLKNGQILEGKENVNGVIGVIRKFMKENKLERQPFEVRIGAMIELPAAALSAADIAKHAEFFSFGTNDLTQTTMGLSRDDINSFLPAYTEMDIWKSDPFQELAEPVKVLVAEAIRSARQVRPDLQTGICGEHAANPDVIKYCLNVGMDYISCSPFGIPIAILAVAQSNLAV